MVCEFLKFSYYYNVISVIMQVNFYYALYKKQEPNERLLYNVHSYVIYLLDRTSFSYCLTSVSQASRTGTPDFSQ